MLPAKACRRACAFTGKAHARRGCAERPAPSSSRHVALMSVTRRRTSARRTARRMPRTCSGERAAGRRRGTTTAAVTAMSWPGAAAVHAPQDDDLTTRRAERGSTSDGVAVASRAVGCQRGEDGVAANVPIRAVTLTMRHDRWLPTACHSCRAGWPKTGPSAVFDDGGIRRRAAERAELVQNMMRGSLRCAEDAGRRAPMTPRFMLAGRACDAQQAAPARERCTAVIMGRPAECSSMPHDNVSLKAANHYRSRGGRRQARAHRRRPRSPSPRLRRRRRSREQSRTAAATGEGAAGASAGPYHSKAGGAVGYHGQRPADQTVAMTASQRLGKDVCAQVMVRLRSRGSSSLSIASGCATCRAVYFSSAERAAPVGCWHEMHGKAAAAWRGAPTTEIIRDTSSLLFQSGTVYRC